MGCSVSSYAYTDDTGKLLNEYWEEPIVALHIGRRELQRSLLRCLFYWTDAEKEVNTLYHVYLMIELAGGNRFVLEKNSTVTFRRVMDDGDSPMDDRWTTTEFYMDRIAVDLPDKPLTLKALTETALRAVGPKKYFHYSVHAANCQDFVVDLLSSSGILTNATYVFVKQQTDKVLGSKAHSPVRVTVNTFTTTDAIVRDVYEKVNGV